METAPRQPLEVRGGAWSPDPRSTSWRCGCWSSTLDSAWFFF